MIDREVQVMTDSTAAIETIEMREAIEAGIATMTETRAGGTRVDRSDIHKEEAYIEMVEIIVETAATV